VFIVGVVRDIRQKGPREKPRATVYVPATQTDSSSWPAILVRTKCRKRRCSRRSTGNWASSAQEGRCGVADHPRAG